MNEINQNHSADETASLQDSVSPNTLNALFTQLNPAHIEQFYQSYQSWILQQKRVALLTQIATLQQKVVEHTEQMQGLAPSALALASLTQLQACGVEDIDLLEKMLERGEVWLDHTIQLLRRCEQLDVIGSDYTEWCEHALEGAYDWIASIGEDTDETSTTLAQTEITDISAVEDISCQITEEIILQKLMSDNEKVNETEEVPVVEVARITQPLSAPEVISLDDKCTKIQDPIRELEEVPVTNQELEVLPVAELRPSLITETLDEIHHVEQIDQERQEEPIELIIGAEDIQADLARETVVVPLLEPQADLVVDDELASLPRDTEDTETSLGIQAYQPSTELSLNTQPTESIPIGYSQTEEAAEVGEVLQEGMPMSVEEEQVNLEESDEQENVGVSQEEGVKEAGLLDEIVGAEEGLQEEVTISIEEEQVRLVESGERERVEEVGKIINLDQALQAIVSASDKIESVSISEGIQQIIEHNPEEKAELSLFDDKAIIIQDVVNSTESPLEMDKSGIISTQDKKKPQQEVIASERGFLRNLLMRIWGR